VVTVNVGGEGELSQWLLVKVPQAGGGVGGSSSRAAHAASRLNAAEEGDDGDDANADITPAMPLVAEVPPPRRLLGGQGDGWEAMAGNLISTHAAAIVAELRAAGKPGTDTVMVGLGGLRALDRGEAQRKSGLEEILRLLRSIL